MGRQDVDMPTGKKMTHDEFISAMNLIHPDIDVLSRFTYAKDHVLCRCKACGNEWYAKPLNLTFKKSPTGCPKCSGTLKKTTSQFKNELSKIHPEIEVIGEYKNSHTPITVMCTIHDSIFDVIPTNILRRSATGCRMCSAKTNDSRLAHNLKKYCVKNFDGAIAEYRVIKNPVTGRWLPYDIYIPDINGEQVFCEIMGQQHYRYCEYVHGAYDNFVRQVARDNYKEMYANSVGRYVEIDIRKITTVKDALPLILGNDIGWIARKALSYKCDLVSNREIIDTYASTNSVCCGHLNLYRNLEGHDNEENSCGYSKSISEGAQV